MLVWWNHRVEYVTTCGLCTRENRQDFAVPGGGAMPLPSLPAGWSEVNGLPVCDFHLVETLDALTGIRRRIDDGGNVSPAPELAPPAQMLTGETPAGRMRNALILARMGLEQGATLATRVAGNGPTLGHVLAEALGELPPRVRS